MADKLMGGDGDVQQVLPGSFWVLAPEVAPPDVYVQTAMWAIEQKYNPERSAEDIRWFASA